MAELALSLDAGARLGRYEILRPLARGGMAELYLARASGLPGVEKVLVLKRILPELVRQRDFAVMFLDEARIATTLHHPNIVHTFEAGEVDGSYYLAMEYIHGEPLSTIERALRRRGEKMSLEDALQLAIAVASALHYAHDKLGPDGQPLDIVHRDVTPQNIMVTYEGEVKLIDFGVAKAANRVQKTEFGTVKGKISYLAPEQCEAGPLDRRADLFSLGVVIYEITTGRRLYPGVNPLGVIREIVDGQVTPPSAFVANYPEQLERIVLRCLEKRPERRHATAGELRDELESLARERQLFLAPGGLRRFMERLFGDKIEAWRRAEAQGKSLEDHLRTSNFTIQLSDQDLLPLAGVDADEERPTRPREAVSEELPAYTPAGPPLGGVLIGALLGAALAIALIAGLVRYQEGRPPPSVHSAPRQP